MSDHYGGAGATRLFVAADLRSDGDVAIEGGQAHYLVTVMRLTVGDSVRLFNGRDGEWQAELTAVGKRRATLRVMRQLRPQTPGPDVHYLFAPLKHARLDYVVQKATEMGVARLLPVITRRTIVDRVNLERMQANVVEAAEQCGIVHLPEIDPPVPLPRALAALHPARRLVFCDEAMPAGSPLTALAPHLGDPDAPPPPVAVLIGPEGGFDPAERTLVLSRPGTIGLSLGPRVMRADTAAVAALAVVNAALGRGW